METTLAKASKLLKSVACSGSRTPTADRRIRDLAAYETGVGQQKEATPSSAIHYALSRWEGSTSILHDGRNRLDSNPDERCIRTFTLNWKNALLAGSDGSAERWTTIASQ